MVVDQINVGNVAVFTPENDSPIRPDCDTPEPLQVPFKGIKLEAGDVHILRSSSSYSLLRLGYTGFFIVMMPLSVSGM